MTPRGPRSKTGVGQDWLYVQEPVSRVDSVRARLSRAAWEDGIGTCFTHSVPFSEGTGRELASRLMRLCRFVADGQPSASSALHVLEVGAGMGMLSKHLLDLLQSHDRRLYDRTFVHVTDVSEATLTQVRTLGVLDDHLERVRFARHDVGKVDHAWDPPPALVYQAFVFDSLPVRHIEVTETRISELLVRTSIAATASLVDTTVFPPVILNADEIRHLLRSESEEYRLATLSRELVPLLKEEFVPVPLGSAGSPLPAEERREVEVLVTSSLHRRPIRFNYSRAATAGLRHMITHAAPESCIVVHDFGFESPMDVPAAALTVSYGGTSCHPLAFGHLDAAVGATADRSSSCPGPSAASQTRMWYQGDRGSDFAELCAARLSSGDPAAVDRAIHCITSYAGRAEGFGPAVAEAHRALGAEQVGNYTLDLITAWEFLSRGHEAAAIAWARRSLKDYGSVAADSYLVLALCHQRLGDLEAAERAIRKALAICPGYSEALAELSTILRRRGLLTEASNVARAAVPGLGGDTMWGLVSMVLVDRLWPAPDGVHSDSITPAVGGQAVIRRHHQGGKHVTP